MNERLIKITEYAANILRFPMQSQEAELKYDRAVRQAVKEELKEILCNDLHTQMISFWMIEQKKDSCKDHPNESIDKAGRPYIEEIPFDGYKDMQLRKYNVNLITGDACINRILTAIGYNHKIKPDKLFVFFDHTGGIFQNKIFVDAALDRAFCKESDPIHNALIKNGILL